MRPEKVSAAAGVVVSMLLLLLLLVMVTIQHRGDGPFYGGDDFARLFAVEGFRGGDEDQQHGSVPPRPAALSGERRDERPQTLLFGDGHRARSIPGIAITVAVTHPSDDPSRVAESSTRLSIIRSN